MNGSGKHRILSRASQWLPATRSGVCRCLCLLLALFAAAVFGGENPTTEFDQANRFYEQGKFAEAAAAYEKLVQSGQASATLYYNLGNACFKAGQNGRAIAAYLQAERLAPRDPNVRFNLQFVRKKVTGSESPVSEVWRRWLTSLTLDEWTVLAMSAFWLWFILLALREVRPALRKTLSGYTASSGVLTVLLAGCLATAVVAQSRDTSAVVVVPNAVVRYGPLEESSVYYQLRDGSEISVLDEKELSVADKKQPWLQVQDAARRIGWLQRDQVILLNPAPLVEPRKKMASALTGIALNEGHILTFNNWRCDAVIVASCASTRRAANMDCHRIGTFVYSFDSINFANRSTFARR